VVIVVVGVLMIHGYNGFSDGDDSGCSCSCGVKGDSDGSVVAIWGLKVPEKRGGDCSVDRPARRA